MKQVPVNQLRTSLGASRNFTNSTKISKTLNEITKMQNQMSSRSNSKKYLHLAHLDEKDNESQISNEEILPRGEHQKNHKIDP